MKQTFLWREKTPPINTFVWAKYSETDIQEKWQLVKTCKRGCCVYSLLGSMMLPTLWYLATTEQAQAEQEIWDNLPQLKLEDLY